MSGYYEEQVSEFTDPGRECGRGTNKVKTDFKMVANNKSCTSDSACYRPPTKLQEGNDLHLRVILFMGGMVSFPVWLPGPMFRPERVWLQGDLPPEGKGVSVHRGSSPSRWSSPSRGVPPVSFCSRGYGVTSCLLTGPIFLPEGVSLQDGLPPRGVPPEGISIQRGSHFKRVQSLGTDI